MNYIKYKLSIIQLTIMGENIKMSVQEILQFKDIKSNNPEDKERLNCVYQHAINEGYKQGIIKGEAIGYEKGFNKGFDKGFDKGQSKSEKRLLYEHMINYYQTQAQFYQQTASVTPQCNPSFRQFLWANISQFEAEQTTYKKKLAEL
jgi:flagellar biosynthesis/type III secretory pathway protein FliH